MVTARKATVLTQRPPRASRAKPKPEAQEWHPPILPGRAYRLRPTTAGPFGMDRPTESDDLPGLRAQAVELAAMGIESVLEHHNGITYAPLPEFEPVMVADLARIGLAHERQRQGGGTVWEIEPEGFEAIRTGVLP